MDDKHTDDGAGRFPASWRVVNGEVRMVDVLESSAIDRASVQYALTKDLIRSTRPRRPGSPIWISTGDALLLLAALSLSFLTGCAVTAALRMLKAGKTTVVTVGPNEVRITGQVPIDIALSSRAA